MSELINIINDKALGTYKENVSLKTLTTYKTGGNARLVVYPNSVDSLKEILKYIKENNIKFKVFGNGSNILASSREYEGVIIKLNNLNKVKQEGNIVEVEAGYNLPLLANNVSKEGYSGLEFACGIPATVGGAVYMNAGAYLSDISKVLIKAEILDEDFNVRTVQNKDLDFSYRHSIFMEKDWIVLKAFFKLEKGDKDQIVALIEDRKNRRLSSQPLEYPSAGSVFRNPEGNYAGKLIEDSNLKGFTHGGGQISDKHANFIINKDNATAEDIKYLMDLAKDKVKDNYGIDLHIEQELFNWEK
ncbi:MAG: UDP-N-acetylmuramate dehydrogenase [Bacilli bacterium]|nr:UDP-N-acetylmuramate dehydrogenase [Bacilli bacterium]